MSRTVKLVISANFDGIEPKRRLKLKSNRISRVKLPREAGRAPVSWLDWRAITFSFFERPSWVGIVPLSWL
jgi:hypothetical protein